MSLKGDSLGLSGMRPLVRLLDFAAVRLHPISVHILPAIDENSFDRACLDAYWGLMDARHESNKLVLR